MCSTGAERRDLLAVLDAAADLLRAAGRLPLGGAVADGALTQAVQKLEAIGRIAQGQKLRAVGEIAQREAHRGHAAASTPDLLARALKLSPGEARAQAELAAGLALVPETAQALADGRIGVGQAIVTVKKADEVKHRDDARELLAKIDATASTVGQELDRNRLAREIDTTVARAGVDVLAERERTAHTRRRVDVTTRDGMTVVHAELDPLGGAHVRAALDALSRPDGEGDRRSYPQRQADALVVLAKRALETKDEINELGGTAQHVILITNVDALHDTPGAEPSILDGHGAISGATARQICCDADIQHVITRNDKILDVRRDSRVATPKQRAAVIARDGSCIGCGAPTSRCQVHHVRWWRDRGQTNLDNLVLVCWTCHQHIHHQAWQVTRDATGRYHAHPPDEAINADPAQTVLDAGPPGAAPGPADEPALFRQASNPPARTKRAAQPAHRQVDRNRSGGRAGRQAPGRAGRQAPGRADEKVPGRAGRQATGRAGRKVEEDEPACGLPNSRHKQEGKQRASPPKRVRSDEALAEPRDQRQVPQRGVRNVRGPSDERLAEPRDQRRGHKRLRNGVTYAKRRGGGGVPTTRGT